MKYFAKCATLEELKREYRKLAFQHHPDRGGDLETMKAINNEYEMAQKTLKDEHNASADEYHQTTETAAEFIEIINILIKLDGLNIELCGSWLWIGGNTKEHRETLKAAGCRWSSNKQLWSWHHAEPGHKWRRGKSTMDEIRNKYGSQSIVGGRESYSRGNCPVAV